MLHPSDGCSLTEFQKDAREHVARLKATGRPCVLSVDGTAEVVVQDVASYEELLDVVDQAEAIIGIQRGLAAMERGECLPLDEAFDAIRDRVARRFAAGSE